jgi:hypothetical protein
MSTCVQSTDEELITQLTAPPALDDGVRSLTYWRDRRRALPWYRRRARREAERMILRWEQRVGAAVLAHHDARLEARVSAGVLVARSRLGRALRRTAVVMLATATVIAALVAIPVIALFVLLLHAL